MSSIVPRRALTRVAASITGLALVAALALASVAAASPREEGGGGRLRHIFVIMLENTSRTALVGDPNAPFITHLATTYAQATNYDGVTHPSEPNYVAAISGSNWFVNDDDPANTFDHTNLVDQLEAHHLSWAAYMDAMPEAGFTGTQWPSNAGLYVNKHNPFVLFTDILSDPARLAHIKPYTSLAGDLRSGHVASFVWITPDTCNDLHGGVYVAVAGHPETPCPYPSTNSPTDPAQVKLVQQADAFVRGAVTEIMASRVWRQGHAAIFIVSDEGSYDSSGGSLANDGWLSTAGCCDSPVLPPGYQFLNSSGTPDGNVWPGGTYGGGNVPAIVVSTGGPRHFTTGLAYNHYSLLRTIEANWNLGYLGNASDAAQVQAMTPLLGG